MLDLRGLATTRKAEDILLGQIRLELAGSEYFVPVLNVGPSARWKAAMEARLQELLVMVQQTAATPEALVTMLADDEFLPIVKDALYQYDTALGVRTGVLPPQAVLDEDISSIDYVRALLEVWAAASPLVVVGLDWMRAIILAGSLKPTSTRRKPTAGRQRKSRAN